jgi:PAS domain S-box-containing protein
MKIAPTPINERERFAALKPSGLAESAKDGLLDELARLAAQICDAPYGVVTMVETTRVSFLGRAGTSLDKSPRDGSFCSYTILDRVPFMVTDASLDERFQKSPLVVAEINARSYLGVPLVTTEGFALGTIGVLDTRARTFTDSHIQVLEGLARQLMAQVKLRMEIHQLNTIGREQLETNRFYGSILNSLPLALFCKDKLHGYAFNLWNRMSEEIFGLKQADVVGKTDYDLFPREQADHFRATDTRTLQNHSRIDIAEEAVDSGNRGTVHVRTMKVPIADANGRTRYLLGISEDVTYRKNTEGRLLFATKLALLGEMSMNLLRDIDAPLTTLSKVATDLKGASPTEVTQQAATLDATVTRIQRLFKGLRTLARKSDFEPFVEISAKTLIDDALELAADRFSANGIKLVVEPISDDVTVECRPSEVTQVLLNLLRNAHDAVLDTLDPWTKIGVEVAGDTVSFTVVDSGTGIATVIADKIMDPFFTTKEVGRGTGLGLSISKELIDSHGGVIYLDSNSTNTRFVARIPRRQSHSHSTKKAA